MARVEFRTTAGGKTYGAGSFELADDAGPEVTKAQLTKFSYKDALVKFDLTGVRDFVYVRRDSAAASTLLINATKGSLHLELGIGPPHELFRVLAGTGAYAEDKRSKKRKKLNAELISDTHFSPSVPRTLMAPAPSDASGDPGVLETPGESSPSSAPGESSPSSAPPPAGKDTRPVDVVRWPSLEHRFAADSPASIAVASPIDVGVTTPVNLGFTDRPANVNMSVQTPGAIGVRILGSSEPIALRLVIAEPIVARSDYEIQLHLKGNAVLSVSVSGTTTFATPVKDG
jgi:hypothetical protein